MATDGHCLALMATDGHSWPLMASHYCSPVQTIDKLYAARQKAGVEQMPGLSFDNVGAKV